MVHFAPAETKVLAQHWKRCCQLIALAGPDQGIPDEVMRCVFEQTEPLCDRLKAELLAGEACLIGFRKGDHEHVRPVGLRDSRPPPEQNRPGPETARDEARRE